MEAETMSSADREARQINEHNSKNHLGTTSNIGKIVGVLLTIAPVTLWL
jgi:hypothetical protein